MDRDELASQLLSPGEPMTMCISEVYQAGPLLGHRVPAVSFNTTESGWPWPSKDG
jgi:hypothetical protein